MRIGVNFFFTGETVRPGELAAAAEALGFDSLWVPEHMAIPVITRRPYHRGDGRVPSSYFELADPFVVLACAAEATRTLRLATGVCLAAQRHPAALAKTVASLDRYSNGRLTLGVGGGWFAEEAELFGVPFDRRWSVLRECIEAMRLLWNGDEAPYEGRHVSFPALRCEPRPVADGGPPVMIGAGASTATFRRIAEWGDGWVALFQRPDEVAAARRAVERECAARGRDAGGLDITVFAMDASPAVQAAYAEAGATRLVIQLYNHPGTALPFDEWEARYVHAVSAPAPSARDTLRGLEAIAGEARL